MFLSILSSPNTSNVTETLHSDLSCLNNNDDDEDNDDADNDDDDDDDDKYFLFLTVLCVTIVRI